MIRRYMARCLARRLDVLARQHEHLAWLWAKNCGDAVNKIVQDHTWRARCLHVAAAECRDDGRRKGV